MKNRNTGLYHFGKSFGNALSDQNSEFDLTYYIHPRDDTQFSEKVALLKLSKLDKFIFLKKSKFDLIHFTDQFLRLNPLKVNAKKIVTIHDLNILHESDDKIRIKTYLNKLSKKIAACDRIVTISKFVAAEVQNYFPFAADKLSVIYNGADKLVTDESHIPLNRPAEKFLFTLGMSSPKKNFHVLPALLYNNDYELVISGIRNNDYEELIFKEAEKFNCQDRIRITGPINEKDKAWYYKNCLAFVFPSIAEGFGLPVIEAMHFGKPVFLSNRTSLPEIGGDVAFYFQNFEHEHMQQIFAHGLKTVADNPLVQELIKKRADSFSWEKTAKSYLNLYQELLTDF